jgi:hypothetical protein
MREERGREERGAKGPTGPLFDEDPVPSGGKKLYVIA